MTFIRAKDLAELERNAFLLNRYRNQTYWMHQGFVKEFLDEYLRGEDISRIRDKFDKDLEKYVSDRCAKKLEQAQKLVDQIKKIDTSDPFHYVRWAIAEYEGRA